MRVRWRRPSCQPWPVCVGERGEGRVRARVTVRRGAGWWREGGFFENGWPAGGCAHLWRRRGRRLARLRLALQQNVGEEEGVRLQRVPVSSQQPRLRLCVQRPAGGAQHAQVAAQAVHQLRARGGWQRGEVAARPGRSVTPNTRRISPSTDGRPTHHVSEYSSANSSVSTTHVGSLSDSATATPGRGRVSTPGRTLPPRDVFLRGATRARTVYQRLCLRARHGCHVKPLLALHVQRLERGGDDELGGGRHVGRRSGWQAPREVEASTCCSTSQTVFARARMHARVRCVCPPYVR